MEWTTWARKSHCLLPTLAITPLYSWEKKLDALSAHFKLCMESVLGHWIHMIECSNWPLYLLAVKEKSKIEL